MVSIDEWYHRLPPVTKFYLTVAVVTTICSSFKLISPQSLILYYPFVWNKFQIWRLFTCFIFFGNFGMPFLFQMFILGRYFNIIETENYPPDQPGKTAEFVTLCLFGAFWMLFIAYFLGIMILGPAMSFMVMYIWSRRDPMSPANFYGFTFKKWQIPPLMVVMAVLMKADPVLDIIGIVVGHLWEYVSRILPAWKNIRLVWTPDFMYRLMENNRLRGPGPARAMPRVGGYRLDQ